MRSIFQIHISASVPFEDSVREVTLTMGGGDCKIRGGDHKILGAFYGGDHKIVGTFYGGDHKINFEDGTKIGTYIFKIENFRGYAAFVPIFT